MKEEEQKDLPFPGCIAILPFIVAASCIPTMISIPKAIISSSWPYVIGKVHEMKYRQDSGSTRNDVNCVLSPRYEYEVDGKVYEGKTFFVGTNTSNKDSDEMKKVAESLIDKKDLSARIYYNPNNPEESALVTGVTGGHVFVAILGGGLILIGIGFVVWHIILKKRKKRSTS
ncbi:hypothetical protein BVX99_02570 [bacterium F16]|nr:hypothetical protein BVX99_02570 [bacterium F16]